VDFTALIADVSDSITSAALSIAPSGAGELAASNLTVNEALIGVWLSGGVAGRTYIVKIQFETTAGRSFERLVRLSISRTLAKYPLVSPPSLDFGTVLTTQASLATYLTTSSGAQLTTSAGAYLTLG
jgi:hypothetical protein